MSKRKTIILLLIISIGGSITSISFLIFTLNGSWSFNLTNNNEENNNSCAISADGQYIVVGSGNDHIYLFGKSSSTPQWSYRADDNINAVDISASGQYIVAGGSDGILYVFERTSSIPLWTYSVNDIVINVGISADGNYIFACDSFGLFLFSRDSEIPLWFKSFGGGFSIAEISGGGSYLVSVSNGVVNFYHKSNSTPLWQYDTGEQFITGLAMTPSGEFFAVGGQDNRIHVFNKTGPDPIQMYFVGAIVRSLAISDNGNYISAGCSDGLYLFEKSNPNRLWRHLSLGDGYQTAMSSDGNFIAYGGFGYDNNQDYIYFFKKSSNTPLWWKIVINRVSGLRLSADGSIIAVAAGFNFYLLNSDNPAIDELYEGKLIASIIGSALFIGIGAATAVTYYILRVVQIRKERVQLEKEKTEKEISGVIESLDGKFKEWNENEEESEKI